VTSLGQARLRLPGAYAQMLDQVEVAVAEQPLPRLQTVGSAEQALPFLYDIDWEPRDSISLARLRRAGPAARSTVICRRALRRSGAAPGTWTSRTSVPASSSRSSDQPTARCTPAADPATSWPIIRVRHKRTAGRLRVSTHNP
jgi:hypothetical protein